MAIASVRRAQIRHYNPDNSWQTHYYDFELGGAVAVKAEVSLAKVNMWDGDVAAEAFISEVCTDDGDLRLCAVYEDEPVWVDYTENVGRITFGLKTYGPIEATAVLLVHVYE